MKTRIKLDYVDLVMLVLIGLMAYIAISSYRELNTYRGEMQCKAQVVKDINYCPKR